MVIDINNIKEIKNEHFKDGEGIYRVKTFDDGVNKIMKGRLKKGCSIGFHKHSGNCEIIYVLEGSGILTDDEESPVIIHSGQVAYCPEGHCHSLKNEAEGDLIFFAVVPKQ